MGLLFERIKYTILSLLLFSHSVVSDSLATPWTVVHQAPLSMGFPRPEYWSGLPFPSLGYLPDPEIESMSPALQRVFTAEPPGKPRLQYPLSFPHSDGKEKRFVN